MFRFVVPDGTAIDDLDGAELIEGVRCGLQVVDGE